MDDSQVQVELLTDVEDSVSVGLYHYLWMRNAKGQPCPDVHIPHTIIIVDGRPQAWYFTSSKDRCIKRKKRSNISNTAINDTLVPPRNLRDTAAAPGSGDDMFATHASMPPPSSRPSTRSGLIRPASAAAGVAAMFATDPGVAAAVAAAQGSSTGSMLGPWPHHGIVARFNGSITLPTNGSSTSASVAQPARIRRKGPYDIQDESVEWFDKPRMLELMPPGQSTLLAGATLHEGVLQRFVEPRGQHNFGLRATWAPNACVVERRTCKAKLNDPRVPLLDRVRTWEGPIWLCDQQQITGTVMTSQITRLCNNVADHIHDVSRGGVKVLRMSLFFKVDEQNRIWLTHCSTLKTAGRHSVPRPVASAKPQPTLAPKPMAPLVNCIPAGRRSVVLRDPTASDSAPATPSGRGPVAALQGEVRCASPLSRAASAALALPSSRVPSLDPDDPLPAPNTHFATSKAAAAAADAAAIKFLCCLTGDMRPLSARCEVTYKQLMQHWFSQASNLPNESDRLRAMDTIPLALRRADPSLTRDWYLRMRSQPDFLYRTAAVCSEAAGSLTSAALGELQRTMTMRRPARGVDSAPATPTAGAARLLGGGYAGVGLHGRPVTAPLGPSSRQLADSAAAAPVAVVRTERPRTSPSRSRCVSYGRALSAAAGGRPSVSRSQSQTRYSSNGSSRPVGVAAPATASGRANHRYSDDSAEDMPPAPRAASSPFAAAGLPSMLVPRTQSATAASPQVPARGSASAQHAASVSAMLQAYAPTPAQIAEAAAVAAALPYLPQQQEGHTAASFTAQQQQLQRYHDGDADAGGGAQRASPPRLHPGSGSARGANPSPQRLAAAAAATAATPAPVAGAASAAASAASMSRMSPPRAQGMALQTIHEETGNASATNVHGSAGVTPEASTQHVQANGGPPRAGNVVARPPHAHPSGRRGSGNPYAAAPAGHALSAIPAVAARSMSESGDFGMMMGGSLNASFASSAGSFASRRSMGSAAVYLSNDDVKTLRELSDAYSQAEQLTQQLLMQAHELLSEDGASLPASAPTSRPASRGAAGGRPPPVVRQPSSLQGPSPLGLQGSGCARVGGSAPSVSSSVGAGSEPRSAAGSFSGRGSGSGTSLGRPPSAAQASPLPRPAQHAALARPPVPAQEQEHSRDFPAASQAAMLTSEEADLLAEALMEP